MKKTFLVLVVLFIQSCGYFDNDGIENINQIKGKFYLSKYPNSDTFILTLKYTENDYDVINADCINVIYDSINRIIYTEKYLNPYNLSYKKVIIVNDTASNPVGAYKLIDLTREQYENEIKNCKNCIVKIDKLAKQSSLK